MNASQEDVLKIIENSVVSVNIDAIKSGAKLSEAGIDSLEIMSVLLGIEERYGIKIEDEAVDSLNTIDQIIAYLEAI